MALEIETPRLLLRRWQQTDLAPFIKMNADPEVMRYFLAPYSAERTKQMYEAIQNEFSETGYGLYAAEERRSGHFIGFIGFHRAQLAVDFCPCVEIGWRLEKTYWNQGYATEGARACLQYGFAQLGFDTVYSFTAVENGPSQRVMQKIGMRFYEYFDHPEVPDGHRLKRHICYVMQKGDILPQAQK